jgi:thiamine biosynthesis lipoprotein
MRVFCSLFIALLLVGCSKPVAFQRNSNIVFGTVYNITYQYAEDLQPEIEAELQKVDGEFSMFNPQSTVARINNDDSTVERSAMFCEIYELAQTVNKETDGAFDIHVAPLVNAWGFGFKHDQLPTPQQVDSLLKIRHQMDFSAIAKGYGCDVVARLLKSHGIENFMVEIGGEVVLSGHNDKDQPWHIGVNKPVENPEDGDLQTVLSIRYMVLLRSSLVKLSAI